MVLLFFFLSELGPSYWVRLPLLLSLGPWFPQKQKMVPRAPCLLLSCVQPSWQPYFASQKIFVLTHLHKEIKKLRHLTISKSWQFLIAIIKLRIFLFLLFITILKRLSIHPMICIRRVRVNVDWGVNASHRNAMCGVLRLLLHAF